MATTFKALKNRPNGMGSLAAGIAAGDLSAALVSGEEGLFATASMRVTLFPEDDPDVNEICLATRSGVTLTLTRGQEGTIARAWPAGTLVQMLPTAGTVEDIQTAVNVLEGLASGLNAFTAQLLVDVLGGADGVRETSTGVNLKVAAQSVPNMTVKVQVGSGVAGGAPVALTVVTNTGALVAPVSNPRIDVVRISSAGVVSVVTGVEGASPSAPATGAGYLKLAEIYCRVGMTSITDADGGVQGYITDFRNII